MKTKITVIAAVLMAVVALAGCGKKATIHPIDVDGTVIDVNVTTVQKFYDGGFTLSFLDGSTSQEVTSDIVLDAESVYSGLYFGKDGQTWGSLEVVTEAECEVGKGVISKITILEEGISHAKLAGVALTDLTPEKAKEIESGLEDADQWQSCVTDKTILRIYRTEGAKGTVTELEQEFRYEIQE